jgi:hypothetical protein
VDGSTQELGRDYDVGYAPVAAITTFRSLLALAAGNGWEVHKCDITAAFLNGDLEQEVYTTLPESYDPCDEHGNPLVLKLKQALYGLRQAPRAWYDKLHSVLLSMGFSRSAIDPCLYTNPTTACVLAFHVDDFLITGPSPSAIQATQSALAKHFDVHDGGPACEFLGMSISQDAATQTITLSQEHYINELLTRFHMVECRTVHTPLQENTVLGPDPNVLSKDGQRQYRELVGALNYLASMTRPDLAVAAHQLSRYFSSPGESHWQTAIHVLRYLRATSTLGLTYGRRAPHAADLPSGFNPAILNGFADASYAPAPWDERRSVSGYVFLLHGAAISWSVKLQQHVALSTSESEYIALFEASREARYLRQLLTALRPQLVTTATPIWEDNRGALFMASNPTNSNRTKHIDVRYHFVRQLISEGEIVGNYIPTTQQLADVLTKPLGRVALRRLCAPIHGQLFNSATLT